MIGTSSGARTRFLAGFEDLLGVVSLGLCLGCVVTAWSLPPEAVAGPPGWAGYSAAAAYGAAAVLFFFAARHLLRTGRFSLSRHAAPVICMLLVPALFASIGPS